MLKTKEEIKEWLISMDIQRFIIKDDLSVDVNDNVFLSFEKLESLPVQFGTIKGNFSCRGNNLKSLKGCPLYVYGSFDCGNNEISSLKYCPKEILRDFYLLGCEISSFEGCPSFVGNNLLINSGSIKNLNNLQTEIGGSLIHRIYNVSQCIASFEHRYIKSVTRKGEYELVIPSTELESIRLMNLLSEELADNKVTSKPKSKI